MTNYMNNNYDPITYNEDSQQEVSLTQSWFI